MKNVIDALIIGVILLPWCGSNRTLAFDSGVEMKADQGSAIESTDHGASSSHTTTATGFEGGHRNDLDSIWGNVFGPSGPGNIVLDGSTQVALPFVAKKTGTIKQWSANLKYDAVRPNYAGSYPNNLGHIRARLFKASDIGAPTGDALASHTVMDVAGGGRTTGNLVTKNFDRGARVIGGKRYALVFDNVHSNPKVCFSSINLTVYYDVADDGSHDDAKHQALRTAGGFFRPLTTGSRFWGTSDAGWTCKDSTLGWHVPAFDVRYADGDAQGQAQIGARFGKEVVFMGRDGNRFRMVMTSTKSRRLESLHFRAQHAHNGKVRMAAVIRAPSGEPVRALPMATTGKFWFSADISPTLMVSSGETIHVDIRCIAGSLQFRPVYHAYHDSWNAHPATHFSEGYLRHSTNRGETFADFGDNRNHDMALYFHTTAAE